MTAHVGGAPVEEMLLPFLFTSGPLLVVAARAAFSRATRRTRPGRGRTADASA
jgi:hypothetical protein